MTDITQNGGGKDGDIHVPEDVTAGEYLGRFLKSDKIERCVTLVVYWGKDPWDGPTKLSELFRGADLSCHTVQLEMNLLDVCRMTDERNLQLFRRAARRLWLPEIRR